LRVAAQPRTAATRLADFGEAHGAIETPVVSRAEIGDHPRPGPLLIDEYDTTVVVRPAWTVRRDETTETLILERPDA
jgi:N-methylhydantoinase A